MTHPEMTELPAGRLHSNSYGVIQLAKSQHIGLVDEGETVEAAAIRELREETGYIADEVLQISPVIVADPGTFQKKNHPNMFECLTRCRTSTQE